MDKEIKIPLEFNPGMEKYEPNIEKLQEHLHDEILIKKITSKRELSKLPEIDVKIAFNKFNKRILLDEEKIKLTRELLHKVFSSFTSSKLLSPKNKSEEWTLRKHLSTRERLPYYGEIYSKLLKGLGKRVSVIDLGAGINGFSYDYFKKSGNDVDYIAIEGVGQLVDLMNAYFHKKQINGKAFHLSLFEIDKIKELINKTKSPRVVFLFKTLDSLEMLGRDYSFKLIKEIISLTDKIVISFATQSMIKKKKFNVNRKWIIDFLKENFKITDDFEIGGERYICLVKK